MNDADLSDEDRALAAAVADKLIGDDDPLIDAINRFRLNVDLFKATIDASKAMMDAYAQTVINKLDLS